MEALFEDIKNCRITNFENSIEFSNKLRLILKKKLQIKGKVIKEYIRINTLRMIEERILLAKTEYFNIIFDYLPSDETIILAFLEYFIFNEKEIIKISNRPFQKNVKRLRDICCLIDFIGKKDDKLLLEFGDITDSREECNILKTFEVIINLFSKVISSELFSNNLVCSFLMERIVEIDNSESNSQISEGVYNVIKEIFKYSDCYREFESEISDLCCDVDTFEFFET